MPKVASSENYRRALAVLTGQYINIDSNDSGEIILHSRILNPEETCIKNDLFERLSNEAKEVIDLVLNGPTDMVEFFASPTIKKVNKRRIKEFFSVHWHSRYIANQAIKEVETWVKNLK